MKWLIRDQVTYARQWVVEADSEEEALDKANNEGPDGGTDFEEDQVDAQPFSAELADDEVCDECGCAIPVNPLGQMQDDAHAPSCSLHPANEVQS